MGNFMKQWFKFLGLIPFLIFTTSCQSRSTTAMWENTKTASRYFGRGLKVLGGKGSDSKLIHHPYEFQGPEDLEYVSLYDEEESSEANFHTYPLAKETPGELGSFLPGLEGFYNPEGQEHQIFKRLHFDTNKDKVKGADDYQTIQEIAKYLKKNPNCYLYILGHCDQRGTDVYNMTLGSRRGNTIRNLLIEQGVNLNRLFTVSYGKEKPVNSANNSKAWEENRRVEFKIYKKK
ncbi:MAG: Peptidoglycan-associated lipoprotein [Chlamydiae bacterium]|nr:Peptidoglycan-associated lipoprotein [Chlamydiota bacterium]